LIQKIRTGGSGEMRDNDDLDTSRPRPKKKGKKKQRPAGNAPLRIALLGGGALAGLLVVGLVIWGIVSLFGGGGLFGPVVAQARPAENKPVSTVLPLEQIPPASAGWKVTPDGLPLASGLTSAVVLPDGKLEWVLFSDPSSAQAAVILSQKPSSVYKGG